MMIGLFLISGTASVAVDVDVVVIIEAFDRVVLRRHLHKLSNNVKPCT